MPIEVKVVSSISTSPLAQVSIDGKRASAHTDLVFNVREFLEVLAPKDTDVIVVEHNERVLTNAWGDSVLVQIHLDEMEGSSDHRKELDCEIQIRCPHMPSGVYTGESMLEIEFY